MTDPITTRIVAIGLVVLSTVGLIEVGIVIVSASRLDSVEKAQLLIGAVALISGLTGTAIGALASLLATTRSTPPPGGQP